MPARVLTNWIELKRRSSDKRITKRKKTFWLKCLCEMLASAALDKCFTSYLLSKNANTSSLSATGVLDYHKSVFCCLLDSGLDSPPLVATQRTNTIRPNVTERDTDSSPQNRLIMKYTCITFYLFPRTAL